MSGKSDKLKEQIEYYLSDENLNSDEFFRKEISNGGEVLFIFSKLSLRL